MNSKELKLYNQKLSIEEIFHRNMDSFFNLEPKKVPYEELKRKFYRIENLYYGIEDIIFDFITLLKRKPHDLPSSIRMFLDDLKYTLIIEYKNFLKFLRKGL